MNGRFQVSISDYRKAQETARNVEVGSYFVFSRDGGPSELGRRARLLAKPAHRRSVLPLIDQAVSLPGLTLTPRSRGIQRIAALVADRDLYRAEQDTAHLLVALPGKPPPELTLALEMNGAPLTERKLDLGSEGVAVEPFSTLLAGRYTARLKERGYQIGQTVSFTVAEYTLAPLSARLTSHQLDLAANALQFELGVESYQMPFDRDLIAALVEDGREAASTRLSPTAPGRYSGRLPIGIGDGPLRLRLTPADDATRVAEVAIPGSRKAERQTTCVSELGREVLLSLAPEAGALTMRGAYLTAGDYMSTPLVVEKVDASPGVIRAEAKLESLVLAVLDLATGSFRVVEHGDVAAGTEIRVESDSPVFSVFAGCFVDAFAFEGYTTFFRPVKKTLSLQVPEVAAPRSDLVIRISCIGAADAVPVLLCVKDQRLTATDTPESALAGSVKRGIDAAVAGMKDSGLQPLEIIKEQLYRGRGITLGRATLTRGLPDDTEAPDLDEAPSGASLLSFGAIKMGRPDTATAAADEAEPDELATTGEAEPLEGATSDKAPAAPPPARTDFPELLFYGIVRVAGDETVSVPLADSLGTFAVEAFALAGGDWMQARAAFAVDQPVRADLDLPSAVHPDDKVTARVRAAARSGRVRVSLARDGVPVPLPASELASPAELEFAVTPGVYRATVTDVATGDTDVAELEVGTPGRFRSMVRELALLQHGDKLTLDSAQALSLRVLPGLEEKMKLLVEATADYGHLCCEQTAAKILAATLMWLTADGPARREKAESAILAGIARERRMWRKGKGFSMYPEQHDVHPHYSPLVVRHLWSLDALSRAPGISRALRDALSDGLTMADDAAKPFKLARVPSKIVSGEDAWAAVAAAPKDAARAVDYIERAIDFAGPEPRPRHETDLVSERALLAYGAAVLIAAGHVERGVRAANRVTRQLNEQGRLYSTVDSVAAIAMMSALLRAGVIDSSGRVRANGAEMDASNAAQLADQVESIEVLSGCVPVEVARLHEEDWSRFRAELPLQVGFRDPEGRQVSRFRMGDRVDLYVSLLKGYKAGDLVHVALPACLSWIEGGGRVKRFSRDFEGRSELSVPLVVTGKLDGKQRFAICVRNMFEEERAASPGLLAIG